MSKYNDELKIKVVKEYKEGYLGIRALAKKHGVKSKSQVGRWIQLHEKYGVNGLKGNRQKQTYSVQFKLDVLSYIERTGSSEMETALYFGMRNSTLISSWKKAYQEGAVEGLSKTKGRPVMSDKSRKNKSMNKKEMTNEQKLKRENELLRLEIEYLKKLRAFQMDPEGYLEKHKQQYHSSSKKNSN